MWQQSCDYLNYDKTQNGTKIKIVIVTKLELGQHSNYEEDSNC